jgi:hypothetical protein
VITHVVAYAMNNVIAEALSPGLFLVRDTVDAYHEENEHDDHYFRFGSRDGQEGR